jgi:hypothetical protein
MILINIISFDVVMHIRQFLFHNVLQSNESVGSLIQTQAEIIRLWNGFLSTTKLFNQLKRQCRVIMIRNMAIRSKKLNKLLTIIQNPSWQLIFIIWDLSKISPRIFRHTAFLAILLQSVDDEKRFISYDFSRCSSLYLYCAYRLQHVQNLTAIQSVSLIDCSQLTDISALSKVKNLKLIGCRNIKTGLEKLQ